MTAQVEFKTPSKEEKEINHLRHAKEILREQDITGYEEFVRFRKERPHACFQCRKKQKKLD